MTSNGRRSLRSTHQHILLCTIVLDRENETLPNRAEIGLDHGPRPGIRIALSDLNWIHFN